VTQLVAPAIDWLAAQGGVSGDQLRHHTYVLEHNNAARHAERPTITAWLTRFEKDLRVAIANVVSPAQRAALAERLTADPTSLFGTFTTTDSGYGLRIVAELVGHAYGIGSITPLTAGGYVGAKLIDDSFVAWFHWPLSDV
jgi:hypothetical protein